MPWNLELQDQENDCLFGQESSLVQAPARPWEAFYKQSHEFEKKLFDQHHANKYSKMASAQLSKPEAVEVRKIYLLIKA